MSNNDLRTSPPEFLKKYIPESSDRPHITLTWAQSLDFKIAGPGGKRVLLSGNESMLMTHWYVPSSARMTGCIDERMSCETDGLG